MEGNVMSIVHYSEHQSNPKPTPGPVAPLYVAARKPQKQTCVPIRVLELPPPELKVWISIRFQQNMPLEGEDWCCLTQETIGILAGYNRNWTGKIIKALVLNGWLRERTTGPGRLLAYHTEVPK